MLRMISIVDVKTGRVSQRRSDTRTFDLPVDLDPDTAVAALDSGLRATYASVDGKSVSRIVHPRPLSWRVRGEECLVAQGTRKPAGPQTAMYRRYAVEAQTP